MTALSFILTMNNVSAQNTTQLFQTIIWSGGNQTFDLGDVTGISGFELNFWMMPYRESDDEIIIPIMRFLNTIEIRYQLYRDPSNVLGNAIILRYNGLNYN